MKRGSSINEFKTHPLTLIMQRKYLDEIKDCNIVLEKNRILFVKTEKDEWKVIMGDGMTPANQLPLQDNFVFDPNEKYTSGNLTLLSHNEED